MRNFEQSLHRLTLDIDIENLAPHQVRLIKRVNSLLSSVLNADEESEFFESSSELMRVIANSIKQGNFPVDFSDVNKIPYGDQALEFSLDNLNDCMFTDQVINYDN